MSSVRAKFMCNEITLRAGSAPNPDYNAIAEEVTEAASRGEVEDGQLAAETVRRAKEREVSQWRQVKLPTVKLNPVYAPDDPNHENYKFWSASPSGELTMTIANPDAAEFFDVGRTYYIDFTEAPA